MLCCLPTAADIMPSLACRAVRWAAVQAKVLRTLCFWHASVYHVVHPHVVLRTHEVLAVGTW
jgi:hypothetical protein